MNYNETFRYLHDRFGKADVVALWEHIAKVSYCDIIETYKAGGLQEIYVANFKKDGDENSVKADLPEHAKTMQIHCLYSTTVPRKVIPTDR